MVMSPMDALRPRALYSKDTHYCSIVTACRLFSSNWSLTFHGLRKPGNLGHGWLCDSFPPWLLSHGIVGNGIVNQIVVFCRQGLGSILEGEIVEHTLHLPFPRYIKTEFEIASLCLQNSRNVKGLTLRHNLFCSSLLIYSNITTCNHSSTGRAGLDI